MTGAILHNLNPRKTDMSFETHALFNGFRACLFDDAAFPDMSQAKHKPALIAPAVSGNREPDQNSDGAAADIHSYQITYDAEQFPDAPFSAIGSDILTDYIFPHGGDYISWPDHTAFPLSQPLQASTT